MGGQGRGPAGAGPCRRRPGPDTAVRGPPARARRCTCSSGEPGSCTWHSRPRSAGTHRPGASDRHRKAAGSGVGVLLPPATSVSSTWAPTAPPGVFPRPLTRRERRRLPDLGHPARGGWEAGPAPSPHPRSHDPHSRRPFPGAEIAPARGRSHSMQPRPRLAKPRDTSSPKQVHPPQLPGRPGKF